MSGKRYADVFETERVKQVTNRRYKISDVAARLGVTPKSLHDRVKKYGDEGTQHQALSDQQAEMRRLKAEIRRVTEERDTLKQATVYFSASQRKIHAHKRTAQVISDGRHVSCFWSSPLWFLRLAETVESA